MEQKYMSDSFTENLNKCSEIVKTWPKWKRDLLITSNSVKQKNAKPRFRYNWNMEKWELLKLN
jgi:hypothetical protein